MSKRIETIAGVIQREKRTSAPGSGSTIAASSSTSRTPAARCAASPVPSPASTAPPGNTQAPPMKRCAGLRLTSSTSSCSEPPRSTITVAAWRGLTGSPALSSAPGSRPKESVLVEREVGLARAADGAEPVGGDVVEGGAGGDAAVRVALGGVVDEPARLADPLLNGVVLMASEGRRSASPYSTSDARPPPDPRAAGVRGRDLDARRRDRGRPADGAVLRRLDDRVGEHDRDRARRAVDRLLVRRPAGRPPPAPARPLHAGARGLADPRPGPDRRQPVPVAERRRVRLDLDRDVRRLAVRRARARRGPGADAGRRLAVGDPPEAARRRGLRRDRRAACTRSRRSARWSGRSWPRCC